LVPFREKKAGAPQNPGVTDGLKNERSRSSFNYFFFLAAGFFAAGFFAAFFLAAIVHTSFSG